MSKVHEMCVFDPLNEPPQQASINGAKLNDQHKSDTKKMFSSRDRKNSVKHGHNRREGLIFLYSDTFFNKWV